MRLQSCLFSNLFGTMVPSGNLLPRWLRYVPVMACIPKFKLIPQAAISW
jgi:hypothetical protein